MSDKLKARARKKLDAKTQWDAMAAQRLKEIK
jgi:hypothetical protein